MSRIGRAIIEVILRSEAAKAGAAAVKTEMQGIKTSAAAATQGVDAVGVKGQQAFEKVRGNADRTGASLNRVDRAFDLVGRNAGKGFDKLGDALERSNNGFTRAAGAVAGFAGKAASVAAIGATFFQLGQTIREAFDPSLTTQRFEEKLAEITAAARDFRKEMDISVGKFGLAETNAQLYDMRRRLEEVSKATDKAGQQALSNPLAWLETVQDALGNRIAHLDQLLRDPLQFFKDIGREDWSGNYLARRVQDENTINAQKRRDLEWKVIQESERRAIEAAMRQFEQATIQMADRMEEIMIRTGEQNRQQANAQLSEIAVSVRNLQQVINIRMRPGAVNLSSSP